MDPIVTPSEWRAARKLTLLQAAVMAGVTGKNPARTWQRWEMGVHEPPISVILAIEAASEGNVTARSWLRRKDY